MILLLLACADPKGDDTATDGMCRGSPTVSVVSPAEEARLAFGERVELAAEGSSTVDEPLVYLWGVGGDVVAVGQTGAWVPDVAGMVEITLQAEDRCGSAQAGVTVYVEGGDSGG